MSVELRQEIKALRIQVYKLEQDCKAREDRLADIIASIEPFLDVVSYAHQNKHTELLCGK